MRTVQRNTTAVDNGVKNFVKVSAQKGRNGDTWQGTCRHVSQGQQKGRRVQGSDWARKQKTHKMSLVERKKCHRPNNQRNPRTRKPGSGPDGTGARCHTNDWNQLKTPRGSRTPRTRNGPRPQTEYASPGHK